MQLLLVYVQLRRDDAASLLSYTENVEAGTESVRGASLPARFNWLNEFNRNSNLINQLYLIKQDRWHNGVAEAQIYIVYKLRNYHLNIFSELVLPI